MSMPSPHTPANWDAASTHYDTHLTRFTSLYADNALELAEIPDHCDALEVAAGAGAMTLALAPRVERLLATDYSEGMLELLRAKLADRGHDHVTCRRMDGMALEVDDATFDRAFSQFGMMLFDSPAKGMAEMRRALRPGGVAVITAWAGPERFETFALFGDAVRAALPDLPIPPDPPPIFSLSDPATFAQMLREAGFSQARVEHATHTLTAPSAEAYVEWFSHSAPPPRALFERIGPEAARRVQDTLHAMLTERFGGGEIALSNTATIGVATK